MLPLYDDQPTRRFPFVTILVIVANLVVFVWWQLGFENIEESVDKGGLVPAVFLNSAWLPGMAHMLSSMFMHAGWLHLIGNMWFLWIFGNNVEDATGHLQFAVFYLLCGIASAYAHIFLTAHSLGSLVPLVGASGAISGVLGAYLILHPRAAITTLGPFFILIKLPAWFYLIVWIGIQVLSQYASFTSGKAGGVAYLAHIGGFFAGLILIFFFNNHDEPLGSKGRGY